MIFAYPVQDPRRYGVIEFTKSGKVTSIEEKPHKPRSHYAVPGLYFYDNNVLEIAANLKPSARNEYEITDINRVYMEQNQLKCQILGRGVAWLDMGTHESLLQAANFVQAVEERQGMMISCPEEIAYRMNFIDESQLLVLAGQLTNTAYGKYLNQLANGYDMPFNGK